MNHVPQEGDLPFSQSQEEPQTSPIGRAGEFQFEIQQDATNLQYCTVNHYTVRRWTESRGGTPSRLLRIDDMQPTDSLFIMFDHRTTTVVLAPLDWYEFFDIFEKQHLAFVYRTHERNGELSTFHLFLDRKATSLRASSEEKPG